jgi:hypothetical protein
MLSPHTNIRMSGLTLVLQVLDWQDVPIPRLYAVGEICSVFQFVYQGGGNLAEGIAFGRLTGKLAAALPGRPAAEGTAAGSQVVKAS